MRKSISAFSVGFTVFCNAKKARGYMARFLVDHRVKSAEGLMEFNTEGYEYRGGLEDGKMLFVR